MTIEAERQRRQRPHPKTERRSHKCLVCLTRTGKALRASRFRMIHVYPVVPGSQLRILVQHIFSGLDDSFSNARCLEGLHHLLRGARSRPFAYKAIDVFLPNESSVQSAECWVSCQILPAHALAKTRPLGVGEYGDNAPAIMPPAAVGALRTGIRVAFAAAALVSTVVCLVHKGGADDLRG